MPTATRARRALGCLAALTLAAAGCGERVKLGRVSGRVTYKGQAVPTGAVTFLPDPGGPPATAAIGPDGTYTLVTPDVGDGAVVGRHAVMITALQAAPAREAHDPLPPPIIPVRYGNTSTSGLTADVKDGENTIDFDLKDDKAPRK
jgi:hypothetical protein